MNEEREMPIVRHSVACRSRIGDPCDCIAAPIVYCTCGNWSGSHCRPKHCGKNDTQEMPHRPTLTAVGKPATIGFSEEAIAQERDNVQPEIRLKKPTVLSPFLPTMLELDDYRVKHQCGRQEARRMLIIANIKKAIDRAETVADIKPLLHALLRLTPVDA